MGAQTFRVTMTGHTTGQSAWVAAVDEARWEYGHGGYTGTIAEKDTVSAFQIPASWRDDWSVARQQIDEVERALLDSRPGSISEFLIELFGRKDAERMFSDYDDKWGPAVSLQTGPEEWTFLGWASC